MKYSLLFLAAIAAVAFGPLVIAADELPATAPAQIKTSGQALFEQHCSVCHNFDGKGGIGLPLTRATLSTVTDAYLTHTIRLGRPGRIMPAFEHLDDAQVADIVGWLRHLTGPSTAKLPTSIPAGDSKRGKALFATHCSACHGPDGRGSKLGTGVTLSRDRSFAVAPPAIVNPGFLASASDPLLVATILNGRPGTVMPTFSKLGMNTQDAADLVAYLRAQGSRDSKATAIAKSTQHTPDSLTHVAESSYDLRTTVDNIKRTLKGYNFRSFPERTLQQGLTSISEVNAKQVALRFCNFNRLYDLLRVEPRLGAVLPCRITVIEADDGTVTLYAPNLRTVATWFNNNELSDFFNDMDDSLLEILDEATL